MVLHSCRFFGIGDGINFEIVNKSNYKMENVRFSTTENLNEKRYDKIQSGKSISNFLSMKENVNDGTFILEFTINGIRKTKNYGYYTNGHALNKNIKYEIGNDTIIAKLNGTKY